MGPVDDAHRAPPTPFSSLRVGASVRSVVTVEDKASALPEVESKAAEPAGAGCGDQVSPPQPAQDRGTCIPSLQAVSLEEAGLDPKPLERLDQQLEKAVNDGEIPGLSYVILKDGRVAHARAFGVTDLETRQPWKFDTVCRIYSMTKTVAVCGFMRLVEDGLVSMSDPISKYIPAFAQQKLQVVPDDSVVVASPQDPAPRQEITIRHLLTHSSGLSQGPVLGDEPSCATEEAYQKLVEQVDVGDISDLEQWCNELAKLPLRFQPGERWEYSYSIDVLGRIIEVVSGKKLGEFLHDEILEPLKMHDTTFALPDAQRGRLASFYRRSEDGALQRVDEPANSCWVVPRQARVQSAGGSVGSVAGGLVSTANDFARFLHMLQNSGIVDGRRILKEETIKSMCDNLLPETIGHPESWCLETVGLGFGVLGSVAVPHPDANWYDVPGEFGWGGLASTAWAVDHGDGLAVLSFCQVMYELWIDEEVRKAARMALGYTTDKQPERCQGLARTSREQEVRTPPKSATSKRPQEPTGAGDETPKRARVHEAIQSRGSSEKLREKEIPAPVEHAAGKEVSNPFCLPLPEFQVASVA